MLNKKIYIYCSNSYEVLEQEYPLAKECLVEFDSKNKRPRGIKEICEYFMELLNEDCDVILVYTISDIAINILGLLIAEGIFDYRNIKLTFVGIDEDTKELSKREAGYTVEGFGNEYWPFGAMSSWYGFYKPGRDKLMEESFKNEK